MTNIIEKGMAEIGKIPRLLRRTECFIVYWQSRISFLYSSNMEIVWIILQN